MAVVRPHFTLTSRKKKVPESSKNGPTTWGPIEKIEILNVISFIEDTMRTLSNYGERLKNQLDINLIQKEIYLTACSFLKKEYILLNKNLNFIPTPKAYKNYKPNLIMT